MNYEDLEERVEKLEKEIETKLSLFGLICYIVGGIIGWFGMTAILKFFGI